jgi:hypothetical protein
MRSEQEHHPNLTLQEASYGSNHRVMDFCCWIVRVVLQPEKTQGFILLKKPWLVEHTFG